MDLRSTLNHIIVFNLAEILPVMLLLENKMCHSYPWTWPVEDSALTLNRVASSVLGNCDNETESKD